MRTTTADQEQMIVQTARAIHLRVYIDRGSADWVDMTTLEGFNWVYGMSYSTNIDQNMVSADIQLIRKHEEISLATLMDSSKANKDGTIVDIGNDIYCEVAIIGQDSVPASGDWIEIFRGNIDSVNWESGALITLSCRDQGGALMDTFIEAQRKHPNDPDVVVDDIEDVMQEILTDNSTSVTLYSPNGTGGTPFNSSDSPGFAIKEYLQQKQPVLAALKVLADQIGWSCRYLWHDNTSAFQLQFYAVNRERSAVGTMWFADRCNTGESFTLNSTTYTEGVEFARGATVATNLQNIKTAVEASVEDSNVIVYIDEPQTAAGSLHFTGQPTGTGNQIVINTTTYPQVTSSPDYRNGEWMIGSDFEETVDHIKAAINQSSAYAYPTFTAADVYASGRKTYNSSGVLTDYYLIIVSKTFGAAPNSWTFTENLANCTADGSGTFGGLVAGVSAAIHFEWRFRGTAGNSIVFTEAMTNVTINGSGTLGGTVAGVSISSLRTFTDSQYYDINKLTIDKVDIRNVVEVIVGPDADNRTLVSVSDATSIAAYGRRYSAIAEDGTSHIDTKQEAYVLANSILDDLSQPNAIQEVTMPYYPWVELGDYYTFTANDIHYDTNQLYAVTGYTHKLSPKEASTSLSCAGKPSGGAKRWLGLEARGVVGPNDTYEHYEPEGVAIIPGLGTLDITYRSPLLMSPPITDWSTTRVYASTTGFATNADSLVAEGRMVNFIVGGLEPDTLYYISLAIITADGNIGALLQQPFTTAMYLTGGYFRDPDYNLKVFPTNNDFSSVTRPLISYPPDDWTMSTGVWGLESGNQYGFTVSGAVAQSGTYSLFLYLGEDPGELRSALFPVIEPTYNHSAYKFILWAQRAGTGSTDLATVKIRWYDNDKAYISSTTMLSQAFSAFATTFTEYPYGPFTPPATATWGQVAIENAANEISEDLTKGAYFDKIEVFYAPPEALVYRGTNRAIPANTWTAVQFDTEQIDAGGHYDNVTNYDFTAPHAGNYLVTFSAQIINMNPAKYYQPRLNINSGASYIYGLSNIVAGSAIEVCIQTDTVILAAGDTIEPEIYHNDGASVAVVAGVANSYWQVKETDVR